MRKLIVTCQCGQRMQVPQSAFGKAGLCPSCGHTVRITNQNATRMGGGGLLSAAFGRRKGLEPTEEDKRRFGEAVDLFANKRYAEALAIFDSLARLYPGSPDIENGRMRCMRHLQQRPAGLLQDDGAHTEGPPPRLDEEMIRKTVLNKLLYGASEEIQLQAAELAARMLGLIKEKPDEAAAGEVDSGGNGKAPAPAEDDAAADSETAETKAAPDEQYS